MTMRNLTGFFLLAGLLGQFQLHAQTSFAIPFTLTQSSPAVTFSIDANGTLLESGPFNATVTPTLTSGPQMLWIPALSAFRAGTFYGTLSNIGQYSTAFGEYSVASGSSAIAFGQSSASGTASVAMGVSSAQGLASTAIGDSMASGSYSFAVAGGTATGYSSTAIGRGNVASGEYAMAFNLLSNSTGESALALGNETTASGNFSTAAGYFTTASAFECFALGQYNMGLSQTGVAPSSTAWVSTDPLLEIGNGTSSTAKSDALVVYKNGNMQAQGIISAHSTMRCAAGGDLSMGSFTAGTAP